jgi:hypothetical protein
MTTTSSTSQSTVLEERMMSLRGEDHRLLWQLEAGFARVLPIVDADPNHLARARHRGTEPLLVDGAVEGGVG